MATDRYPKGKFACVLCGHDVAIHGLEVGCDACTCAATPGEAAHNERVDVPYEGRIFPITEVRAHYKLRPEYGKSLYAKPARELAHAIAKGREVELPTVECPTCRGSGAIAYGRYGSRPPKRTCMLCLGKGKLERGVADAFRVGVEMGRSSAYIGHYDQYDTGSLMFSDVDDPYAADSGIPRVIKGEVNGRSGF